MAPARIPSPASAKDDATSMHSSSSSSSGGEYGHQIVLEDHSLEVGGETESRTRTRSENGENLNNTTESPKIDKSPSLNGSRKFSLREELARRKYAKWQHRRATSITSSRPSLDAPAGLRPGSSGSADGSVSKWLSKEPEEYEVDVLYENQRGSFFFGVPMFSHKSLLNLDPAPWVNVAFRDSPVDIVTAQVPNPSWRWAWNSWYVDMSGDVDEEGWTYSLGFSSKFSWHGTHFWLNSFVRRRRWLRKRVRVKGRLSLDMSGRPSIDEQLSTVGRLSTHSVSKKPESIAEVPDTPLSNLLRDLKSSRLDREKLQALERYMRSNSDNYNGLSEAVPEILTMLFFEASRRHFLARLKTTLSKNKEKESAGSDPTRDNDNLQQAVGIADRIVKQSEFWSDLHPHKQSSRSRSIGSNSSLSSEDELSNAENIMNVKGKQKA